MMQEKELRVSIPNQSSTDNESVEELLMSSVYDADLFDTVNTQKRKRRDVSEPTRKFQSLLCEKRYKEADSILLEDRSNSRMRQFKIFNDRQVFADIYKKKEFITIEKEEKNEECDYDTEPEHVIKARELMLEDLHESIKFFVEE